MNTPDSEPLVLDIMGPERSGKSDFACSVSLIHPPTLYLALDWNYKGPVNRHRKLGAEIHVEEFFYQLREPPPDSPKVKNFQGRVNTVAKITRPVFQRFKDVLWDGLASRKFNSLVIDNGTSLHLLCRLALFGYIHKVPLHLYAKRTLAMSTILNQVRFSQKNVVWIHRQAETWGSDNKPTGEFERMGAYKEIAYEVMATLRGYYNNEKGKFGVEILDSTFNNAAVGRKLLGSKRTFENVSAVLQEEE